MSTPRLELFYDIVSPYTRFALAVLERYCITTSSPSESSSVWPLQLVLRPAFLGGVMKSVGNVPPATLPQRAPYLLRDVGRLSTYLGVPMMLPEDFPANTLTAMRFLAVVDRDRPELQLRLANALYARHWGQGQSVSTPADILAATDEAGVSRDDVEPMLAKIGEAETKERLKQTTDEVVARGAFGFPAMFVTIDGSDELFFGHDRIPLLAHELKLPWRGPQP